MTLPSHFTRLIFLVMQNSESTPQNTATPPTRSRGRPRAFDRMAALDQATRLFWLKGFEATSMADLTKAMGIGSPSLYAAFGSKEALYAEAVRHYGETYEGHFWNKFYSAATAREAVESLLIESATALTGCLNDTPRGCMMALSSVGSEGHAELGELLRSTRAIGLERLIERFELAVAEGELPTATDIHSLARFVQTIQSGMSILARDGATHAELESVTQVTMMGWDAKVNSAL